MIIRNTNERMEIVLDTSEKIIWIIQRWKCRFVSGRYRDKWKENEQKYFRSQTKLYIESIWGNAAYFTIDSKSGNNFNRMYGGMQFTVKVKIDFVDYGEHWNAIIYKQDQLSTNGLVCWSDREVYLTKDAWVNPTNVRYPDGTAAPCQIAIAHEYGHMIGNCGNNIDNSGPNQYTGDEYEENCIFFKDKCSIMNIGSELRSRHFIYLKDQLHSMVPGTQFSLTLGGTVDLIPWD